MSAAQVLGHLQAASVEVWVEAGNLRLQGRQPAPDLLAQIRQHKVDIISLLNEEEARVDAAEAAAMAEHYAATAGPVLPERDPLAEGLLRGFWAHRGGSQ